MTLYRKLSLWFLGFALLAAAIGAAWLLQARTVQRQLNRFANTTTPTLVALGQVKSAALDLVTRVLDDTPLELATFQEFQTRHDEWMNVYAGTATSLEEEQLVKDIETAGTVLYARVRGLTGQPPLPAGSAEAARQLTPLLRAKQQFVHQVDRALSAEVTALKQEREAVNRSVTQVVQLSLAAVAALGLLAVGCGLLIARTIALPVVRLARDAAVVGSGRLDHRTAVRGRDEIGELAEAFNRMTENLERTTVLKRYVDNIISSMVDALVVAHPDGIIQLVNRAALQLLGYAEGELLGQPIAVLFEGQAPVPSLLPAWWDHVRTGGAVTNEERAYRTKTGQAIPVLFSSSAMRDEEGQVQGLVCVALDITRLKEAERALKAAYEDLKKAQQQLVQSEKLAALGRFSAGVAHEVKNPLGVILGGVEFLRLKFPEQDDDLKMTLGAIEESVIRADTIVRDLLKFARPSALQREALKAQELVEGTLSLMTHSGSLKNVTVVRQFTPEAPAVLADRNQVQQVLLNLMMNALDAMNKTGQLTVSTSPVIEIDRVPMCLIKVTDTGEGIAQENLAKLFEPFFTTKRDKKGTGLGLSVSKTIVESHGGRLTIESEQGKGTTVIVALPAQTGGRAG
jgi:PAS domain S-box-containing protein